uniref:Ectonucleotide pyrophosphatase/phosphodiesterase family member 1 n=1 Tax=Panagrellus redivivus TaxID=6233 RepID=A0A7E4W039_PANRE
MGSGVVHPAFPEQLATAKVNQNKAKKTPKREHCLSCLFPSVIIVILLLALPAFIFSFRDMLWRREVVTDIPKCAFGCNRTFETPPLLLISFDGFRADYFTRNLTPTLKHLFECGVTAPHMISSFPSITFPNHYSIVTGLYPGYHGIIDNALFGVDADHAGEDAPYADKKVIHPRVNGGWYGGEPIWNTAHKAGKKSAVSFWPGSEVVIQGLRPDYWQKYDAEKDNKLRIDEIINYLNLPSPERPDFYTFYYENPDGAGHEFGTDSPEVNEALEYVDSLVIYLLKRLDEEGLLGCINIVFVSDHGMENLKQSPEFHANLASVMDTYPFNLTAVSSTIGHVYVEKEEVLPGKSLLDNFRVCRGGHPFAAWTRQDIPRRYHYTSKRAGSLIFESEPGSKFFEWVVVI